MSPSPELLAWIKLNAAGAPPDAARALVRERGAVALLAGAAPWAARARAFDAEAELERVQRLGAEILVYGQAGYPDLLSQTADAPILLYCLGTPPARAAVAVVGSREPTPYGRRMARRFAREAAAGGLAVASGLARGIDTEAHAAALEAGGTTWAVLGSGLSRIYPSENRGLAETIAARGGCVLSEFPIEAAPRPENFPRRNRVVAGLAWATVVVEGAEGSGSLITARIAAEQGRTVCGVPGPADSPLSDAPHRLLSAGAVLARSMADIWEHLPPGCRPAGSYKERDAKAPPLAQAHHKILELLGPDALSLEELAVSSGLAPARLTGLLTELELEDLVVPVEGQRYAKR